MTATRRHRLRFIAAGLLIIVAIAAISAVAAQQIRSPARIAADTAPPKPSLITAPVDRRRLSTEVIGRGTVRYGAPQDVVLPTSALKTGSQLASSQLISRVPVLGARLGEGALALSVSGRPVFVLRGDTPAHRDLHPGIEGPDVAQLKRALNRMGFLSGPLDSHYDAVTAAAVAAWYGKAGWTPFGATDAQAEQLRTAQAAAATAQSTLLQAELTVRVLNPTDMNKAVSEAITAYDAVSAAALPVITATQKAAATRDARARAEDALSRVGIPARRDLAVAQADFTSKNAALANAIDAQAAAQRALDGAAPDLSAADRQSLRAALRKAVNDVTVARADVNASQATLDQVQSSAGAAATQARTDVRQAVRDENVAAAELRRARAALGTARAAALQAHRHTSILTAPRAAAVPRAILAAAQAEVRRTQAEVSRIATLAGIQVPADEILFFPTLPLRVDAVYVKPADPVTTRVMTVTNSRLAIDSSLAINDAALVHPGQPVTIEQQELGIKIPGTVTRVAARPGTNGVDPTRMYLAITPQNAPPALVGSSVKVTIAVQTTKGDVLAVPLSALSVAADGTSRVLVDMGGGRTRFVTVVPGLAAQGFAEIRSVAGALRKGDQVVIGSAGSSTARLAPTTATQPTTTPTATTGTPSTGATPKTGTSRTPHTTTTGRSGH